MEDVPVERDFVECADITEDMRVRQSEYVNMSAVHLQHKLEALQIPGLAELATPDGKPVRATILPNELVEALVMYIETHESDMQQMEQATEEYETQCQHHEEKCRLLREKADRVKGEVAFLSEKSSAELRDYRELLRQSSIISKERNKDLADINRKREKAEMDIRRTDMEMERLRKIGKRAKC